MIICESSDELQKIKLEFESTEDAEELINLLKSSSNEVKNANGVDFMKITQCYNDTSLSLDSSTESIEEAKEIKMNDFKDEKMIYNSFEKPQIIEENSANFVFKQRVNLGIDSIFHNYVPEVSNHQISSHQISNAKFNFLSSHVEVGLRENNQSPINDFRNFNQKMERIWENWDSLSQDQQNSLSIED